MRGGGGHQAVTGLHSGPESRKHQAAAGPKEERGEVGGWPADTGQNTLRRYLTLVGVAEDRL